MSWSCGIGLCHLSILSIINNIFVQHTQRVKPIYSLISWKFFQIVPPLDISSRSVTSQHCVFTFYASVNAWVGVLLIFKSIWPILNDTTYHSKHHNLLESVKHSYKDYRLSLKNQKKKLYVITRKLLDVAQIEIQSRKRKLLVRGARGKASA